MSLLRHKRNDSFSMLLYEWKVKEIMASGNSPSFQPKIMTCVRNVAFLGETLKSTLQEAVLHFEVVFALNWTDRG
jgi:hypothetical protein